MQQSQQMLAPSQQPHPTNPFVNSQLQLQQHQQQQQQQQQQMQQQHTMMLHHSGYSMESEEGDIEDNRGHSLSSSKSNISENSMVSFNLCRSYLQFNINVFFILFFRINQASTARWLCPFRRCTSFWCAHSAVQPSAIIVLL